MSRINYKVIKNTEGINELCFNYSENSAEAQAILDFINGRQLKLVGRLDGAEFVIYPDDILYIEIVDDKTFAYTKSRVLQLNMGLREVEEYLNSVKYFRCSKSMIVNIDKVETLKSLSSNRIDAVLENGEHIIISRTYASDFRKVIRGDYE